MNFRSIITFIFCYLPFALLAYFFQTRIPFSSDVAYLIHAANTLLAGGHYASDIFETNPPMILYLYFPVCLLTRLTTLDVMQALHLYVFLLALSSSALCFSLLKKIIPPSEKLFRYFLLVMIWLIFLFLPSLETGQREHLLVLLMLPYLLLAAARLMHQRVSMPFAILTGLFAGMGFALKPFFLVTPLLIELFMMQQQRRFLTWVRTETITVLCVLLAYAFILLRYHTNYLHIIVPLLPYYFARAQQTWTLMLTRPIVIFCFATLFTYPLFYRHDRYRTLNSIIWLSLLGMIAAFLIPKSAWFYHTLPALSLACLLLASISGQLLSSSREIVALIAVSCLLYSVPAFNVYYFTHHVTSSSWTDASRQLKIFIEKQPGKQSIYCFSAVGTAECFPLVTLTHSEFGGRFPFFWWLSVFDSNTPDAANKKNFLLTAVTDDLNHYQPAWIILNSKSTRFLSKFNESKDFRQAWQHYHRVKDIDIYQIYARTP